MGKPSLVVHNFEESLRESHSASDLPFWGIVYKQAFPSLVAMVDHRKDGEHQRAGIDRSLILENSKQILVDEKVRGRNKKTGLVYEDIALEYWSDVNRADRGWVEKSLRADYIAYAIAPLGRCYLLPVPQLQEAWRQNKDRWIFAYPRIQAPNSYNGRQWVTVSVGIPVNILFQAIGQCLRLEFEPCEFVEVG